MLGRPAAAKQAEAETAPPKGDPCPLSPRSIIEAVLFVGHPNGSAFSSEELARSMRDVSPAEVDVVVSELNRNYEIDGSPYQIITSGTGYRLALREEFLRLGHKLHGKVREAKLSPQSLEVLAVVAYRQPVTAAEIDALRKAKSGAALAQLVRRGLVQVQRTAESPLSSHYRTTDRFLRLFGLASLSQLPQVEDFDLIAA